MALPNRKELPFLLALLDDDSYVVRKEVTIALKRFGPALEDEVQKYYHELDPYRLELLEEILEEIRRDFLGSDWISWLDLGNTKTALEDALVSLSRLIMPGAAERIGAQLDGLARKFVKASTEKDVPSLINFLLGPAGFRPVPEDRRDLRHDMLAYALKTKTGSPLALTCVAMLVGSRVGIDLHGIAIHGHFMPVAFFEDGLTLYNLENHGKAVERSSVMYMEEALRRNQILPHEMSISVPEITMTILRNAIESLLKQRRHREAHQYVLRYKSLAQELRNRDLPVE
ncbi:MAG: hypothetical protein D6722_26415 [Bacteroidetes bacterium]|nr:MAG: hypothetical protein D6722_26415 [Bacteroidota bacterium]